MNYYKYEKQRLTCPKCNWSGLGKDCPYGDAFGELFEILCPECHEEIGTVSYPTHDEVFAYGTDEDKESLQWSKNFHKKVKKKQMKSLNKLPDIDSSEVSIITVEKEIEDDYWLEVYANERFLWKEIIYYEYYERFIEICELLAQKYKGRIVEIKFEPSMYLGGDSITAFSKVQKSIDDIISKFNDHVPNN